VTVLFTSGLEGEFHEALNVAAVWDLPTIFLIENNGYGLSTPTSEQYRCKDLADRGIGYGMRSVILDGNNVLEVYQELSKIASEIRENPHPVLVECKTFRMRGHEEASGTKYVPRELMAEWAKKDPISNYEAFLIKEKVIKASEVTAWTKEIKAEIEAGLKVAADQPKVEINLEKELEDLYAPHQQVITPPSGNVTEKRFVDAIHDGLKTAMQTHENLVIMGQDVADYGGVFKITDGFTKEFGKARVRNTPICESSIIGIGLGLSLKKQKAMVEMQFADFVTCGFNQIVNYLAKLHYRWGENADVVIRMPTGGGVGAGPFHSQSNEAWFTHTPGLKVLYPSTPADAKGMLLAAFEDPNPVLFFEHKALYRSVYEDVPTDYYTLPLGKASLLKEGTDITIITYGAAVHWALDTLGNNAEISADLIDLRSLQPLDTEAIYNSVKKTGKAIILQEDSLFGSISSDISAMIMENCFEYLDAPVKRLASIETPIPFDQGLEQQYLAKNEFEDVLKEVLAY